MTKRLCLLLMLLLAACQPTDQSATTTTEPSPTSTPLPTETATATAVATTTTLPSPTATASPTPANTPTKQPATPTITPSNTATVPPTETAAATATVASTPTATSESQATATAAPTAEATVNSAENAPIISDFSASHWTVGGGEPLVLSWQTENATSVVLLLIDADGGETPIQLDGTPNDSYTINWQAGDYPLPPLQNSNNEYRLYAHNDSATTSHSIRVTHDPSLAAGNSLAVKAFTITPGEIEIDDTMTMRWDVSGAERIDIYLPDAGPDTGGKTLMFSTTDLSGSRVLNYHELPTYFFDSYGLSTISLTLEAFDKAGQMVDAVANVTLLRPVSIGDFSASAGVISAETPVTINYGVNWAFTAIILLQHPSGDYPVHDANFIGGSPAQPHRAGRSFTLTWADITQNGSLSHDGGTITLRLEAYGDGGPVTRTITLAVDGGG